MALELTPRTQMILEEAEAEALRLGSSSIGTEHLLLALAKDEMGVAGQILQRLGVVAAIQSALTANGLPPEWSDFASHPAPWSSEVVTDAEGNPVVNVDGTLRQYFVDAQGHPVLDQDGRRMHVRVGPDGRVVRDERGLPELVPVETGGATSAER